MMDVQVVLEHDPETGHVTATVPGMPHVVVDAKTERTALRLVREAIAMSIAEEGRRKTGSRAPSRSSLRAKIVTVSV